jgi:hypothetical protein
MRRGISAVRRAPRSFEGFGTWIFDEPCPERLKMSILSEEDAPEPREWAVSSWSHRRVRFLRDVNGNEDERVRRSRWASAMAVVRRLRGSRRNYVGRFHGFAADESSAQFKLSTFTPGSPRRPKSRASVFCLINSRNFSSLTARALATRGVWSSAFRKLM